MKRLTTILALIFIEIPCLAYYLIAYSWLCRSQPVTYDEDADDD